MYSLKLTGRILFFIENAFLYVKKLLREEIFCRIGSSFLFSPRALQVHPNLQWPPLKFHGDDTSSRFEINYVIFEINWKNTFFIENAFLYLYRLVRDGIFCGFVGCFFLFSPNLQWPPL